MTNDIDRVLVAGASGRTGREILDVLADDVTVQAITRSRSKRSELSNRGVDRVVVGDLLDPADAKRAVDGCDAVLSAVGTGSVREVFSRQYVDGQGTINLVESAVRENVERFVMLSSIGVGDSKPGLKLHLQFLLSRILAAKHRAERHLRAADLPHTIIRPGGLTDEPATDDIFVAEGGDTVAGTIPRADVARLMVAALRTPDAEGRTFEAVSRDGLRGRIRGIVRLDWGPPVGDALHQPTAEHER